MISRSFVLAGLAILTLLGTPRQADAGLVDWIWEMSGPRMIGVAIDCRFSSRDNPECYLFKPLLSGPRERPRSWLSLEGGLYFSIPKEEEDADQDYGFGDVWMVAIDPVVHIRSMLARDGRLKVYHGVGASYNVLFGGNFSSFDKLGAKIRPIAFEYEVSDVFTYGLLYTVRLYANEFRNEDFGIAPRTDDTDDRPKEFVHGVTLVLRF